MALLTLNFESEFLKGNTEIHVIMPDREQELDAKKFYTSGKLYPVLWLLHGGGGDYSDWIRKTKLELYACENELVVVTFSDAIQCMRTGRPLPMGWITNVFSLRS